MRVPCDVNGKSAWFDHTLLCDGTLSKVDVSIRVEDGSTWLVPSAVRQLVNQYSLLPRIDIEAQET